MQVSKDVKRIRHFEHTLLLDYQLFLSQCDGTIKGTNDFLGEFRRSMSPLIVGLSIKGEMEKKKRRERKKPVVLLENDKELSAADMEVIE